MTAPEPRLQSDRAAMARNGMIVGVAGLLMMALRLVSLVLFARLVPPAAFGLAAIPISLTLALAIIVEFGMTVALVRAFRARRTLVDSVFWAQVALGAVFAVLIFAASPFIAHALGQPASTPLIQVVSIVFLANGIAGAPSALLQRAGRFQSLALAEFGGAALGFVSAMALALYGGDEWALLAFFVIQHVGRALLIFLAARFWPRLRLSRRALSLIFRFSGRLTLASAIDGVGGHGDRLIVARFLGVALLGLYHQAQNLAMIPVALIVWPTQTVFLAALAPLQKDTTAFTADALIASRVIVALTAAAYSGAAALAEPLTVLALGSNFGMSWSGAASLLFILCIGWFLAAAAAPLHVLYQARGQSEVILRISIVGCVATLSLVGVGAQYGAEGAAAGMAAAIVVRAVVSIAMLDSKSGPSAWVWLCAIAPSFAAAVLMHVFVAAYYPLLIETGLSAPASLALVIPSGCIVFGVLMSVLDPEARRFVQEFAKARTRRRG